MLFLDLGRLYVIPVFPAAGALPVRLDARSSFETIASFEAKDDGRFVVFTTAYARGPAPPDFRRPNLWSVPADGRRAPEPVDDLEVTAYVLPAGARRVVYAGFDSEARHGLFSKELVAAGGPVGSTSGSGRRRGPLLGPVASPRSRLQGPYPGQHRGPTH